MNKDWIFTNPTKISEVTECLKSPKCHNHVVMYESNGLMFLLNPFGGGTCNTTELKLSDSWKLEPSMLNHISIIKYKGVE